MAKPNAERELQNIQLSIRIDLPDGSRFGPGKAALLSAIADYGSIASAARALTISYPKALRLVDEMNTQFAAPLVETYQGGPKRGGAIVTKHGGKVAGLYTALTDAASAANVNTLKALKSLSK